MGQKPALPRRSIDVRFAPNKQTPTGRVQCDAMCRFCCKSPKLPGANFSAVEKSDRRPPFDVASITLPRSPASLSSGDEVPHIFTRNSRVQPKEILITSAKRLLQQNLPGADSCSAATASLFDHPIGADKNRIRDRDTENLGGLQVKREFDPSRLLDRQVGGLGSIDYLLHVIG
jgi:hypothetical protein